MSHRAPRCCRFGVAVGFAGFFRRSFVFSARSPYRWVEKGAPVEKGKRLCPGRALPDGGCGAERSAEAQIAAPWGSAFSMTDWPSRPAARGEAAPTEVCMDLHRPGGKCPLYPVCLDQRKTLLLPPSPKNFCWTSEVHLAFFMLAFNLQN